MRDSQRIAALKADLDAGEAETIALALELPADLVLLDEKRGRQVAHTYGLHVTGLLGVLLVAKAQGVLPAIKPALDALLQQAGFRLSQQLYSQTVHLAGEE